MVKCMLYGSPWGQKYNLLTGRLPLCNTLTKSSRSVCPKSTLKKKKEKRTALEHYLQAINSIISILSQAAEWLCTLNKIISHSLTPTQVRFLRPEYHRSTCCLLCIKILLLGLAIQTWPCDPSHDWICDLSFKSSREKQPCLLAPLLRYRWVSGMVFLHQNQSLVSSTTQWTALLSLQESELERNSQVTDLKCATKAVTLHQTNMHRRMSIQHQNNTIL